MSMSLPGTLSTAAAVNFGTCWGTPNGLDLSMPSYMATGSLVVVEQTLRRWTTSQGQLVDDPNYGQNIYDLVGASLSSRDLAYYQQRFAQEAEQNKWVLRCSVTITISPAGDVTLKANIVTANGPISLVLSVNAVTLQLLLVQP